MITADNTGNLTWRQIHRFFIIEWIAGEKHYVKKTYCGRIVSSPNKIDAKLFEEKAAHKYVKKLQTLTYGYAEFSVRELDRLNN